LEQDPYVDVIKTHTGASSKLIGDPIEIFKNKKAAAKLLATKEMTVDTLGLVHGGFTFGLADYAAMLAVNHVNVVLASAQVKFVAPVKDGQTMIAEAVIVKNEGKKYEVDVNVKTGEKLVLTGTFICYILEEHVLKNDLTK
jgi:uncharacterized protein (TIGR00369 family)